MVSPALTDPVAEALADRMRDLGRLTLVVIVDADPEVYRLEYGTESALDKLQKASSDNLLDLRFQPGVRIGVLISDEITMVFAPVPRLIEAVCTTLDKPNGIILGGGASGRFADATGASTGEVNRAQEIGSGALTPKLVDALKQDLCIIYGLPGGVTPRA